MPRYLEFEVELKHIKPRLWRHFRLEAGATFMDLHEAIRDAFGWSDDPLWEFSTPGVNRRSLASAPVETFGWQPTSADASEVPLLSFFMPSAHTQRCIYSHTSGDGWEHIIDLRKCVTYKRKSFHRHLLGGARNSPPEGCGGSPGYHRMVEVATTGRDPFGDDADRIAKWLDGWTPETFDLEAAQAEFAIEEPRADGPTVIDLPMTDDVLPDGVHPKHRATAVLLARNMTIRDFSDDLVAEAQQLWADFVTVAKPEPRKPSIYAASVEYCVRLTEEDHQASQDQLAAVYGTSAASISKVYRQIREHLDSQQAGGLEPAAVEPAVMEPTALN